MRVFGHGHNEEFFRRTLKKWQTKQEGLLMIYILKASDTNYGLSLRELRKRTNMLKRLVFRFQTHGIKMKKQVRIDNWVSGNAIAICHCELRNKLASTVQNHLIKRMLMLFLLTSFEPHTIWKL